MTFHTNREYLPGPAAFVHALRLLGLFAILAGASMVLGSCVTVGERFSKATNCPYAQVQTEHYRTGMRGNDYKVTGCGQVRYYRCYDEINKWEGRFKDCMEIAENTPESE